MAAGCAWADGYRPDEFLNLDLSKAALSPKPLGPPAQFEPIGGEPKSDPQSNAAQVDAVPMYSAPKHVAASPKHVAASPKATGNRIVHAHAEKPRLLARTKLVRRHSNPLDAQASDTRIQVWPCRSGGICNWQR